MSASFFRVVVHSFGFDREDVCNAEQIGPSGADDPDPSFEIIRRNPCHGRSSLRHFVEALIEHIVSMYIKLKQLSSLITLRATLHDQNKNEQCWTSHRISLHLIWSWLHEYIIPVANSSCFYQRFPGRYVNNTYHSQMTEPSTIIVASSFVSSIINSPSGHLFLSSCWHFSSTLFPC